MIVACLKEVYKNKKYTVLTVVIVILFVLFAIFLPNTPLIIQLFRDGSQPLLKTKILINLIAGIQTNFTLANRIFAFIIAILFAIYLSLFIYFLEKRKQIIIGTNKTGIFGLISGIFGVGCASCGSFILSTIFSTAGAVGIITLLPFKGAEFSIISIVLLSFSIYTMSKNIIRAGICSNQKLL